MDLSLIICTRNRDAQLGEALQALERISSSAAWEIVIVDNGSTDQTAAVIAKAKLSNPRIVYVFEAQQGLGAARDTAWRHAQGGVLSFTDDDCYPSPDFVDAVLEVFRDHPEADYIGGRITLHDPADAPITIDLRTEAETISPYSYIHTGRLKGANISFRRAVLEKVGGLDRGLGAGTPFPCEDADLLAAASWAGFAGRFDPRFSVAHHHGRKVHEAARLREGYDRGRGAYYMKYIMRADTRLAYVRAWFGSWRRQPRESFEREARSALLYLRTYGSRLQIAVYSTVLLVALKTNELTRRPSPAASTTEPL